VSLPKSSDILYVNHNNGSVAFLELKNRPFGSALQTVAGKIYGSLRIAKQHLRVLPIDIRGFFLAVSPEKNAHDHFMLSGRLRTYLSRYFTVLGDTVTIHANGVQYSLNYAMSQCEDTLNQKIEAVM